nr:MAG TPA: hypothetical protein [Caudoviricetes sp.]
MYLCGILLLYRIAQVTCTYKSKLVQVSPNKSKSVCETIKT